jgi:hypothetical protein
LPASPTKNEAVSCRAGGAATGLVEPAGAGPVEPEAAGVGAGCGAGGERGGGVAPRDRRALDIAHRHQRDISAGLGTTKVYTLSSLVILNRNALNTAGPPTHFLETPGRSIARGYIRPCAIHSIVEPIAKSHCEARRRLARWSARRASSRALPRRLGSAADATIA